LRFCYTHNAVIPTDSTPERKKHTRNERMAEIFSARRGCDKNADISSKFLNSKFLLLVCCIILIDIPRAFLENINLLAACAYVLAHAHNTFARPT
jgi:hypothetical protein